MVEGADHRLDLVAAAATQPFAHARSARLGVIVSLQVEADCLRHFPADDLPLIFVSGGSPLRARAGAEQLRDKGAIALVSFGLAVGLAPVLRPGDVVLADTVVLPERSKHGHGSGLARGSAAAPRWQRHQGAGRTRPAATSCRPRPAPSGGSSRRRSPRRSTPTVTVAEVAAAAGLPLLVVRAVAEPAEEMRPAVAFAANDADGHPRSLAMVGHLAMRPWEILAAWRFSKNDRLALESLRRVIPIGPDPFAFGAL